MRPQQWRVAGALGLLLALDGYARAQGGSPPQATATAAHDASVVADKARQLLIDAQTTGGYWLPPLEQRADDRTVTAATLLLEAHELSERAEGAARAIGFARRGETWKPFDLHAEAAALFGLTG